MGSHVVGSEPQDVLADSADGGLDGVGDLASGDAPGDATVVDHCVDCPLGFEAWDLPDALDGVGPEVDWVEEWVLVAVLGDDFVDLVVLLGEEGDGNRVGVAERRVRVGYQSVSLVEADARDGDCLGAAFLAACLGVFAGSHCEEKRCAG